MAKAKVSIEELQKRRGVRTTPFTRAIFITLIVVAVVGSLIAVAMSIGKANELPESEKIVRSLSGQTLAQDRASAIDAVAGLLRASNAPATIEEAGDTIGQLESGDFSSLAPDFADRIRYYDSYADNPNFQGQVAMSVYSLAAVAKQAKGGEIQADNALSAKVRVDQQTGIAQVPIDIFTGGESPVAFQMVYVDGSWKLEPHTLTTYILLSSGSGSASPTS